jgi:hypothetical protein
MWNYRIIKSPDNSYGLYEVFYNDAGEISAHAENEEIIGESPEDIVKSLKLMLSDANKHISQEKKILNLNEIKFAPLCDEKQMSFPFDCED